MLIKNNIKVRQIMMVFIAFLPISKVLTLLPILARYTSNQIYLPMIINFILDTLVLIAILKINDLYPDKTFFAILEEKLGNVGARIIFFFFAIFFLLKTFIPILEQKYFVDSTLYENFPNFISFFPILLVTFYASLKGLKVLGRCADIVAFFTIAMLIVTAALSLPSCDLTNLLPIKLPQSDTVKASYSTALWYFDSLYMLLFLGHFDNEKRKNTKIILSFIGAGAACVVIAILFIGVFGPIAETMNFAVSDMTIFTSKIVNVGRLDYLTIFLLLFCSIFSISLPVFATTKCLERAFGLKKGIIPAIAVSLLIFVLLIIFEQKFYSTFAFIIKYVNVFTLICGYALPIVLYFVLRWKYAKV